MSKLADAWNAYLPYAPTFASAIEARARDFEAGWDARGKDMGERPVGGAAHDFGVPKQHIDRPTTNHPSTVYSQDPMALLRGTLQGIMNRLDKIEEKLR